ncbi:MAG: substrate-binding domain-containing protein, partial [Verrucomicrobia bacterium]|nr:substrate-binding domain-containing protein [Verrucomicrobiota bacterium]
EAQRELLGWSGERRLFKGATSERANFIGAQWLKQSSGRTLLRALRNRKPGFLCATQEFAVQLIKLLRQEGVAVPDEAGLVGPELISDQMPTETLAQVRFPRQELLERAVEHAIAEDYHEIRELVPPSLIVGATLAVLDSGKQRKTCSQK